MILVIATRNAGKLREYRRLLPDADIALRGLDEVGDAPEVTEDASTYLENARAKARAVAASCGFPALADDSGLEVDVLNGAPGVRSARFAADHVAGAAAGEDRANIALLLERLRAVPEDRRTARFRCAIVVAHPDGRELTAEGSCDGVITRAVRGASGFGYDPLFLVPAVGRTFAELSAEEKDRISHRARAVARLRSELRRFLS